MKLSQFAFLDKAMGWKVEKGRMELLLGASAADIRAQAAFEIEDSLYVDGQTDQRFLRPGKRNKRIINEFLL